MAFEDYVGNQFQCTAVWPNQGIELRQWRELLESQRLLRNTALASLPGEWRHPDMTETLHESGLTFWAWRRLWPGRNGCPLVDHRVFDDATGARFPQTGFPGLTVRVQVWAQAVPEGAAWRTMAPGGAHDAFACPWPAVEALMYFGGASGSPHAGEEYTREVHVAGATFLLYSPRHTAGPGRLMVDRTDGVAGDRLALFRVETSPPIPAKHVL